MNYEYNGHLLENDRINLVANEIISKYSEINLEQAKKIAMLEGKISTEATLDIKFNRLYNIILITKDNKELARNVYNDLIDLLQSNGNDEKINYYAICCDIALFFMNEREFPDLNEY